MALTLRRWSPIRFLRDLFFKKSSLNDTVDKHETQQAATILPTVLCPLWRLMWVLGMLSTEINPTGDQHGRRFISRKPANVLKTVLVLVLNTVLFFMQMVCMADLIRAGDVANALSNLPFVFAFVYVPLIGVYDLLCGPERLESCWRAWVSLDASIRQLFGSNQEVYDASLKRFSRALYLAYGIWGGLTLIGIVVNSTANPTHPLLITSHEPFNFGWWKYPIFMAQQIIIMYHSIAIVFMDCLIIVITHHLASVYRAICKAIKAVVEEKLFRLRGFRRGSEWDLMEDLVYPELIDPHPYRSQQPLGPQQSIHDINVTHHHQGQPNVATIHSGEELSLCGIWRVYEDANDLTTIYNNTFSFFIALTYAIDFTLTIALLYAPLKGLIDFTDGQEIMQANVGSVVYMLIRHGLVNHYCSEVYRQGVKTKRVLAYQLSRHWPPEEDLHMLRAFMNATNVRKHGLTAWNMAVITRATFFTYVSLLITYISLLLQKKKA